MISDVYRNVQDLLNKNNFGFLTPMSFNQYAKSAQLELFTDYFSNYNKQVNLENARRSGTDYADLKKKIEEDIERFLVNNFLKRSSSNIFYQPSLTTTGDEMFRFNKVLIYSTELDSGTNTSVTANRLVDSGATFVTTGVSANDIVVNTTANTTARVTSVVSNTQLALTSNIFTTTSQGYLIISGESPKEAEKVTNSKITLLNNSLQTAPNTTYPAYVQDGSTITVYPSTIDAYGQVLASYFRFPYDPKWTYVTLVNGTPVFDATQSDYQDFEVANDEYVNLVIKICQYAGLEIREQQVINYAKNEEIENKQQ